MLTAFIGRLAYAILAGVVTFLIVLGIGLLLVHFITSPGGTSYGNEVRNLAAAIGVLVAIIVFCTGRTWPTHPVV